MSHLMPPPRFSRVYHLQVKTHRLTIMLSGLSPGTLISELKSDTLSALKSDVAQDTLDIMAVEPPQFDVETEEDFELCRAVKERGKPTGQYEIMETTKAIRDFGLAGWDYLYLQFRNRSTGELEPITYTLAPLYDDDDATQVVQSVSEVPSSNVDKGKRKADSENSGPNVDLNPI